MSRGMLAASVFACIAPCVIGAKIQGTLNNFDAYNRSGQMANDFEAFLGGVDPGMISDLYTAAYPNTTVTAVNGGIRIRWSGHTTPNNQWAHFGIDLNVLITPNAMEFTWTFNQQTIDEVPAVVAEWYEVPGEEARLIIRNRSLVDDIRVKRRTNVTNVVGLNDLLVGGTLWNNATLLDAVPVPLSSGQTLTYDYHLESFFDVWAQVAPVMMYEVTDSSGQPLLTMLSAARVVPEPGAVAMVVVAGTLLTRRRR